MRFVSNPNKITLEENQEKEINFIRMTNFINYSYAMGNLLKKNSKNASRGQNYRAIKFFNWHTVLVKEAEFYAALLNHY